MNKKTLMIQGTMSDVGKSILVAALCRYFKRQNINVAPFKPQNMSLNSAVAADGGEIGRAQALQAQAAEIPTSKHMNPILLKPQSDTAAQVIIQGYSYQSMTAESYLEYKSIAWSAVNESFNYLSDRHDFIVIEGAGSPAEINLRENDIANMGFAEAIDCPVILVGDIDRGGVFAQFVGTLELLSTSERNRIIGFVINKFRGDLNLLTSGITWLEQKTGIPVLAVIPYLTNFFIDSEDGFNGQQQFNINTAKLNVIVPVTPHISNHTDFDPLRLHPQINFQFVNPNIEHLPPADLIILAGSKSVIPDFQWLKDKGWDQAIKKHVRYGGRLMGICGGFQMLGVEILDPQQTESSQLSCTALGLLEMHTTMHTEKTLKNVQGKLTLNNAEFTGYEIHQGISSGSALENPLAIFNDGEFDGAISQEGNIFGTYIHGIFDNPAALASILQWASPYDFAPFNYFDHRERMLNVLGDVIEKHFRVDVLLDAIENFSERNCVV